MNRARTLLALAVLSLGAAGVVVSLTRARAPGYGDVVASGAMGPPLWPAPTFSFIDLKHGAALSSETLKGRPYIASFLFTTCRTLCPLLSSKLVMLQRRLPEPELRFVSFSVDPERDTQEALKAYAEKWNRGETRWLFARTAPTTLAAVADGFGVAVEKGADELNPIIHSGTLLLVDAAGQIRQAYDSTDDVALKRLVQDAQTLMKAPDAPVEALRGEALFMALSCQGCHGDENVAPPLGGLIGRERVLADGTKVVADAAYVRESIVSPGVKKVRGYVVEMPAYAQHLPKESVESLVEYLSALPTSDAGEVATIAIDPVCHMKVRVTPTTPHFDVDGGTVYFCAELCRARFAGSRAR